MQSKFLLYPRLSAARPAYNFPAHLFCLLRAMSSAQHNGTSEPPSLKVPGGKKEVKVLMLHGFTQSGPLFHTKTRALEKLLVKTLSPFSLHPTLIYPTGPNRLHASDIPGYTVPTNDDGADEDFEPDTWAWFRKHEASGTYRYWDEGMNTVAKAIQDFGGIDGVCGFSQGAAVCALVAAALEPQRSIPDSDGAQWAQKLREANGGKGVNFAVSYSGFWAPVETLSWCYEPKITTPTLHYRGSLDTVVEESRTQGLIDRCEDPKVVVHPGGHHVPVSKEWVMPLAGFIKENSLEDKPKAHV